MFYWWGRKPDFEGAFREEMIHLAHQMVQACLTLLAAFGAGYLLRRAGVPGGMMLGGILGAAGYNLLTGCAYMPSVARLCSQSVAGGFLGASLDRGDLKKLPRLAFPLLIIFLGLFCSDLAIGFLITRVSPLDGVTALTAGIAGGINDIPLIAEDLGADAGKVAVLQFVRLLAGIGLFPVLIRLLTGAPEGGHRSRAGAPAKKKDGPAPPGMAGALLAAFLGGIAGKLLGIPAGSLICSMAFAAAFRFLTGTGYIPPWVKQAAQLLAGAYIGCMLDHRDVLELKYLLLPALVLVAVFAVNGLITSAVISRRGFFSRREAMLAASPAGAGEIALISSDLNIAQDMAADIMVLHILRVILAVSVLPQLVPVLAPWL